MKKETIEEFLARGGSIKLCGATREVTKKVNSFGKRNHNKPVKMPRAIKHSMTYDIMRCMHVVRDISIDGDPIVFEGTKKECVDFVNKVMV